MDLKTSIKPAEEKTSVLKLNFQSGKFHQTYLKTKEPSDKANGPIYNKRTAAKPRPARKKGTQA